MAPSAASLRERGQTWWAQSPLRGCSCQSWTRIYPSTGEDAAQMAWGRGSDHCPCEEKQQRSSRDHLFSSSWNTHEGGPGLNKIEENTRTKSFVYFEVFFRDAVIFLIWWGPGSVSVPSKLHYQSHHHGVKLIKIFLNCQELAADTGGKLRSNCRKVTTISWNLLKSISLIFRTLRNVVHLLRESS